MQDYLDSQASAAREFARFLVHGDLEALVPPCPGWRLADLADHLGGIHQWATHAVLEGNPDAVLTRAPSSRNQLVDWYEEAAATLLTTLTSADPDQAAWTFGPAPRTVSFWRRRQAHETTIHLWDAAASQGRPAHIDTVMALDGIDEVLAMFFPRQVRLQRIAPPAQAVAFFATDHGRQQRWVLAGDGTGPASAADAPAQVTIEGPAEALLLVLWRRIGLDDVRLKLNGDEAAAHAVLTQDITP